MLSLMQIRDYVLKHGDIRKKKIINVGGQELEVNAFDDDEDPPAAVFESPDSEGEQREDHG